MLLTHWRHRRLFLFCFETDKHLNIINCVAVFSFVIVICAKFSILFAIRAEVLLRFLPSLISLSLSGEEWLGPHPDKSAAKLWEKKMPSNTMSVLTDFWICSSFLETFPNSSNSYFYAVPSETKQSISRTSLNMWEQVQVCTCNLNVMLLYTWGDVVLFIPIFNNYS